MGDQSRCVELTDPWRLHIRPDLRSAPEDEIRAVNETTAPLAVACPNFLGDQLPGQIIRLCAAFHVPHMFLLGRRKYDRRSTVGAHHYVHVTTVEMPDAPVSDDVFWEHVFHTIRLAGYTPVVIHPTEGAPLATLNPAHHASPLCVIVDTAPTHIPASFTTTEQWYHVPHSGVFSSAGALAYASIALYHVTQIKGL